MVRSLSLSPERVPAARSLRFGARSESAHSLTGLLRLSSRSLASRRFSEAPVLAHPDPTRQFVVEVDASESGLGVVLCQCSAEDHRLHPCAFYSRSITPAEHNYDVGDGVAGGPCRLDGVEALA